MMDHRPPGWIGTVLQGQWRIESKIAQGGVATVFRATHRRGHDAAIKILHPEYTKNPNVRSRFLREGYVANTIGHPGVVRVLDDDVTEDGAAFIVMELLEHGELLEKRREKRGGHLPVEEVAYVCDQVLDVLAAAHDKGIIHRDIKPENVFVLADGTVKVLDFGIAHVREATGHAGLRPEPTATGLLLGTPDFMAPEQAIGRRGQIDVRTDIYGVGAMMFTLLSGEFVHVRETLNALLLAVSTTQARSLSSTRIKGFPQELVAVVDKALMLEKHRRWPSAVAMREALRASVRCRYALASPPPPPRAEEMHPRAARHEAPHHEKDDRDQDAPRRPNLAPERVPGSRRSDGAEEHPRAVPSSPSRERTVVRPLKEAPMAHGPASATPTVPREPGRGLIASVPDTTDPWTAEFTDDDMEGPTVSVNDVPPSLREAASHAHLQPPPSAPANAVTTTSLTDVLAAPAPFARAVHAPHARPYDARDGHSDTVTTAARLAGPPGARDGHSDTVTTAARLEPPHARPYGARDVPSDAVETAPSLAKTFEPPGHSLEEDANLMHRQPRRVSFEDETTAAAPVPTPGNRPSLPSSTTESSNALDGDALAHHDASAFVDEHGAGRSLRAPSSPPLYDERANSEEYGIVSHAAPTRNEETLERSSEWKALRFAELWLAALLLITLMIGGCFLLRTR